MTDVTGRQAHRLTAASETLTPVRDRTVLRRVIIGASLGTVFEWDDFFIHAILAASLSGQFFSGIDPTSAFIVILLSFSAHTAIRPLGALVFGRYGDLLGRKRTFLVTIVLMGTAIFCIGLLPNHASWGVASAVILVDPASADPARVDKTALVGLLSLMMLFATMAYGPMAALLVEMFPPRIRLTPVSTANNIGNGWFGGFTSPIAFALAATRGDLFAGLRYCTGITTLTLIVGAQFLRPATARNE